MENTAEHQKRYHRRKILAKESFFAPEIENNAEYRSRKKCQHGTKQCKSIRNVHICIHAVRHQKDKQNNGQRHSIPKDSVFLHRNPPLLKA